MFVLSQIIALMNFEYGIIAKSYPNYERSEAYDTK